MRRFSTAALALCISCGAPTGSSPDAASGSTPVMSQDNSPSDTQAVGAERAAYYRQAFPKAKTFEVHPIPSEMVRSIDADNDTYVVAKGGGGAVLGYLRDVSAPVSIDARCECDPLDVTLAFDADYSFRTLISPAPLRKYGHEALTDADVERLIALMKSPPPALSKARQVEDVVDVTTGATRPEYQDAVVKQAALSTRRIFGLVQDTQRILQRAPVTMAQRRLGKIFDEHKEAGLDRARALAAFVPEAGSVEVAVQAFQRMVRDYLTVLRATPNSPGDETVEARIIEPRIGQYVDAEETLAACYDLARDSLRPVFVARCTGSLKGKDVNAALLARLVGTVRHHAGELEAALAPLAKAAKEISIFQDPALHLRFADVLAHTGRTKKACDRARDLFVAHPLFPDVQKVLTTCVPKGGSVDAIVTELRAKRREQLLATRRNGGEPTPTLEVEDMKMKAVELPLSEPGKVTVLIFFATWCPHCRTELPRLNDFAKALAGDAKLGAKVRMLGIRTAIEKETEPYETFASKFSPAFPVWTDPVMALAFSKFAKSQGISPGIPTVAVIDGAGHVRYLLETGTWSDTRRELQWAVEDVLETNSGS